MDAQAAWHDDANFGFSLTGRKHQFQAASTSSKPNERSLTKPPQKLLRTAEGGAEDEEEEEEEEEE
eukprot:CAMPEP_0195013052 /NCGR_PEP_ID=MMETSP0326_2-20130528/12315_1 /TAXON_ID=2866 ORGANISM="Crypthecodinium cohnii, Strain Seligo" /NCGR_SAMPLE_ID=MMETSP0326_2 /ASSEMBLY_ACC=CAM_ASM_000348 /LENGTH=65 /DNA_ID=CAMNT_0040022961 /DNA_START=43 /DNA_END=237 /DNA_ORIENTATION=+